MRDSNSKLERTIMRGKSIKRDIGWGIQWAVSTTLLCFIPASLGFLGSDHPMREGIMPFLLILTAYLLFAALAGALAGICRPYLKTWYGSGLFGASIGAVGFTAIIVVPQAVNRSFDRVTALVAMILGLLVGGAMGEWIRWRSRSWSERRIR